MRDKITHKNINFDNFVFEVLKEIKNCISYKITKNKNDYNIFIDYNYYKNVEYIIDEFIYSELKKYIK